MSEKAYEAISHQQMKLALLTIMNHSFFFFFSMKLTLFPLHLIHSIPINQAE